MTGNSDHWLPWGAKGVGLFLLLFAAFVGLNIQSLGFSLSLAVGVVMGIPIIFLLMFADLVTRVMTFSGSKLAYFGLAAALNGLFILIPYFKGDTAVYFSAVQFFHFARQLLPLFVVSLIMVARNVLRPRPAPAIGAANQT